MAKLIYDVEKLQISQEGYDPKYAAKTESILAQGNGYLGLRAVDEEVRSEHKEDLFVNGIFNRADDQMVPELANLADSIQTQIRIDGVTIVFTPRDKYRKTLDLRSGLLTRVVTKKIGLKQFEFTFKRFVSLTNKHCYAQQISIKQLAGAASHLNVLPGINGRTTNNGAQHLKEGTKKLAGPTILQYFEMTNQTKHQIAHTMFVEPWLDDLQLRPDDDFVIKVARRQVAFDLKITIAPQQTFCLQKYMMVQTSIDLDLDWKKMPQIGADAVAKMAAHGFDRLLEISTQTWVTEVWDQFKIKIDAATDQGRYDWLALNFAIYHLTGFVPTHDSRLGIGAKGLSGEGYQGHSYWDNEFFITPIYSFVRPSVARKLLEYRYRGLAGARQKAFEFKAQGAAYPWEAAWSTDGEVTPFWGAVNIKTGEQVPIASRRQEQHVSADMAFAVEQYFQITHDTAFMATMGIEIIIETGLFWATRAEWNASQKHYQYTNVMGPNEYKGNIDNNAYTNYMAKHNIELAIKYLSANHDAIKNVQNTTLTAPDLLKLLQNVAAKIYLPQPDANGVIAENDQFRQLAINDLSAFQFQGDAGQKLFQTERGLKMLAGQIVKQADVVLLTYILPTLFTKQVIAANYEYYQPKTTHDSSLSAATYAIQAADLNKLAASYRMFQYAINVDLGPNMMTSNQGIHAGSLGAIWQAVVYGFGGLRMIDDQLHINPHLPPAWKQLSYGLHYRQNYLEFTINRPQKLLTITKLKPAPVTIYLHNQALNLTTTKTEVKL